MSCLLLSGNDASQCQPIRDKDIDGDHPADRYTLAMAFAVAEALPGGIRISDAWAKAAAAAILLVGVGVTAAELEDTIKRYFETPILSVIASVIPFAHPCERQPTFSPGGSSPRATRARSRGGDQGAAVPRPAIRHRGREPRARRPAHLAAQRPAVQRQLSPDAVPRDAVLPDDERRAGRVSR